MNVVKKKVLFVAEKTKKSNLLKWIKIILSKKNEKYHEAINSQRLIYGERFDEICKGNELADKLARNGNDLVSPKQIFFL